MAQSVAAAAFGWAERQRGLDVQGALGRSFLRPVAEEIFAGVAQVELDEFGGKVTASLSHHVREKNHAAVWLPVVEERPALPNRNRRWRRGRRWIHHGAFVTLAILLNVFQA